MMQLGLFSIKRTPAIRKPVDPDGQVVQGLIDKTYRLPNPRMGRDFARLEIHRHRDGLWMWGTSWTADMSGGGYRVGEKWGKFAKTAEDAVFYAASELIEGIRNTEGREAKAVLKWAEAVRDNPEGARQQ